MNLNGNDQIAVALVCAAVTILGLRTLAVVQVLALKWLEKKGGK